MLPSSIDIDDGASAEEASTSFDVSPYMKQRVDSNVTVKYLCSSIIPTGTGITRTMQRTCRNNKTGRLLGEDSNKIQVR